LRPLRLAAGRRSKNVPHQFLKQFRLACTVDDDEKWPLDSSRSRTRYKALPWRSAQRGINAAFLAAELAHEFFERGWRLRLSKQIADAG
jgi:hypothetical protein